MKIQDFVVLDLETTGLSVKEDQILEIGAVKVQGGEVTASYETFVNPGRKVPERITELTGIRDEMIANAPDVETAVRGFLDFCGGLPMGLEDGCAVLMLDQRAHGKSEGKYLTFGVKERLDCLCWIDFIRGKCGPDVKILLYGMSMGAATVLMAAGEDLPENVVGIAADCGYSSPRAIIRKVLKDRHMSVALYPLVRLGAILFAHFDPDSVGADTALERCRIPVLLVHGDDDRFVPCDMSREMYRRCGSKDKELLIVPTAGHGASYLVDYDRYRKTVSDFVRRTLHPEG